MFDPKKMLDDLLGSSVPGAGGTVRDKLGQAGQMAKDNPLAAGALAAVLLGTGTGRAVTGSAPLRHPKFQNPSRQHQK